MALLLDWASIEAVDEAVECVKLLSNPWIDGLDVASQLERILNGVNFPETTANLILHGVARSLEEDRNPGKPKSIAKCVLDTLAKEIKGAWIPGLATADGPVLRLLEAFSVLFCVGPESLLRNLSLCDDYVGARAGQLSPFIPNSQS